MKSLLNLRPGITDFASLVFRNEAAILKGSEDSDRDYMLKIAPAKMQLALEYVHSNNLWIDCKIVAATIGSIVGIDPLWCFPKHLRQAETAIRDSSQSTVLSLIEK